jgi:anaerobic selenocysteine-containing dehydrogenase
VPKLSKNQLLLLPVTRLYDHGTTLLPTTLLEGRLTAQSVWVHPKTSAKLGLAEGGQVEVKTNDWTCTASLVLDDTLPEGVGLIPRSVSVPIIAPQAGEISQLAPVPAD